MSYRVVVMVAILAGILSCKGGKTDPAAHAGRAAPAVTAEPPKPRASRLPLPFGVVDTPASGATLKGKQRAGGWALSAHGIEEVVVYLDGKFMSDTTLAGGRPDVAKAHPGYPDSATPGWNVILDFNTVAPGPHVLTVQARSKGGAVREIGNVQVKVVPDAPTARAR